MKLPFTITRRRMITALAGFLLGAIWILAIRFVLISKDEIHYHANFAVFVNGERESFESFTYYEEVQSCGGDEINNPRTRVHMHDRVNHIVHVHDNAATWGHFFANLGFGLGADYLKTDKGVYVDGEGGELRLWLNGQPAGNAYNSHINSEDVLLISFGDEDQAELQKQYDAITKDAADYNSRNDPSACAGGKPLTLAERIKQTIKFWE